MAYLSKEKERQAARAYRQRNLEQVREKGRREGRLHYVRHHKRIFVQRAYRRAKELGLDCNITVDDIQWPTHCPRYGVKLDYNVTRGRKDNSPSLDRIDNTKGYVKGNVEIICWRANRHKSDATLDELRRQVQYLEMFYGPPSNAAILSPVA